jgi:hypothetical protein
MDGRYNWKLLQEWSTRELLLDHAMCTSSVAILKIREMHAGRFGAAEVRTACSHLDGHSRIRKQPVLLAALMHFPCLSSSHTMLRIAFGLFGASLETGPNQPHVTHVIDTFHYRIPPSWLSVETLGSGRSVPCT